MVGWALCAKVAGVWQAVTGWLRPGATVTAGEAAATINAVEVLEQGGRVITDCKAVYTKWHSIRSGLRSAVGEGRAVLEQPCGRTEGQAGCAVLLGAESQVRGRGEEAWHHGGVAPGQRAGRCMGQEGFC